MFVSPVRRQNLFYRTSKILRDGFDNIKLKTYLNSIAFLVGRLIWNHLIISTILTLPVRYPLAGLIAILLDWANCHSLRFSYASHLAMAGVPLYAIKELLGHSTIKTTEIHAHLAEKHKTDMASKLPY